MKINKYLPFAFIYFFLNSVGLPFGLTYTALLAPFFYVWILRKRKKEILLPFLLILTPFIIVQLLYPDVVRKVYFASLLNIVLIYIFCQAVYTFLKTCKDVELVFRPILYINFFFCLIAIGFYFTPWYHFLWYERDFTPGARYFLRLKLLSYEPSVYATLFTPIFCFYFLQYLFKQSTIKGWKLLPMLFLPLLLSVSFGVIGSLFISAALVILIYFGKLLARKRILRWAIFGFGFLVVLGVTGWFFFRDTPIAIRLENIFLGADLSGNGKTIDSFIIANKLIEHHPYFGIGLGQLKIQGADFIQEYYMIIKDFVPTIPNAIAETLAVMGWTGVILRMTIEIFLFFYTKVWTNYFRLLLFLFVFIFQFTGSYFTNIAEFVIWIFAFTNVFKQFDVKSRVLSFTQTV